MNIKIHRQVEAIEESRKRQFEAVKSFFQSWGMYPHCEVDASDQDLNWWLISQGLNRMCYERMLEQADKHITSSKHGNYFGKFCRQQIENRDGGFCLKADRWEELEEAWTEYVCQLW